MANGNSNEGKVVDRLRANAAGTWGRFPRSLKLAIVVVAIVAVSGGAVLSTLDYTTYKVLFSNLTVQDAGAIVEKLKDDRVPFKLDGNGTTISVPASKVDELRLSLASAGLPVGGGVGFELFDQQKFGMTEFEEQLSLRRALEGELSRTISRIDVVRAARVHLVLPKRTMLGAQAQPAQASVVIEMQRGRELAQGTVRSIVHLVSSSVEGLSPDRVTLVDTAGRLLSAEIAEGPGGQGFDYQKKMERDLESRVGQMLDQLLGPGASVVRISADMDFSEKESTEEHYDPEKTAVRSEKRETESSGSSSDGGGGIPGAQSNLPGGAPPASSAMVGNTRREMETKNYEIDRVTSKTVKPLAQLNRLSVAVIVDGANKPGEKFVARPADEVRKIESAVRGAVGFNKERGDNVEVLSLPFHVPEAVEPIEDPNAPLPFVRWLPVAVGAAVALLLALALFAFARRRRPPMGAPAADYSMLPLPRPVHELEAMVAQQHALPAAAMAGADGASQAQAQTAALMGQVRHMFLEESETASRVLRNWLSTARKNGQASGAEVK
jgi:flagellar M-ring protein FliF